MAISLDSKYNTFLADCQTFLTSPNSEPPAKSFAQIRQDHLDLLHDYSPTICARLIEALSKAWAWIQSVFCCATPSAPKPRSFLSSSERQEIRTQFAAVREAYHSHLKAAPAPSSSTPPAEPPRSQLSNVSLSNHSSSKAPPLAPSDISSHELSPADSLPSIKPSDPLAEFPEEASALPGSISLDKKEKKNTEMLTSSLQAVGLSNAGQNCWCNAFLQLIIHIPSLKAVYEKIAHHLEEHGSETIATQYCKAFPELEERRAVAFSEKQQRKLDAYYNESNKLTQLYKNWIPQFRDDIIRDTLTQFDFYATLDKWYPNTANIPSPPLPEAPPPGESSIDMFSIHFSQLLQEMLPFSHEQILKRIASPTQKQSNDSIAHACGLALRYAFVYTRQQYPLVSFKEVALAISQLLPEILMPFIETSINTHHEAIFGPAPAQEIFEPTPPLSMEDASLQVPIYASLLLEALTTYEEAQQNRKPLDANITQNVRSALHCLSPLTISTDYNESADAHEPFSILNRTYEMLFNEPPPYYLHQTLKKRYEPNLPLGFPNLDEVYPELGPDHCRSTPNTVFEIRLDWQGDELVEEKEEEDPFSIDWDARDLLPPPPDKGKPPLPAEPMITEYFHHKNPFPEHGGATFIVGDSLFHCDFVDETIELNQYPEEFFVVLNRFTQFMDKKNDPIDMPFQFTFPAQAVPEASPDEVKAPPTYELDAFITHLGQETSGGHYVAYWKNKMVEPKSRRRRWVEANDADTSLKTQKEIQKLCRNGYIYHYQRKP